MCMTIIVFIICSCLNCLLGKSIAFKQKLSQFVELQTKNANLFHDHSNVEMFTYYNYTNYVKDSEILTLST